MNSKEKRLPISRRNFLQAVAVAAATPLVPRPSTQDKKFLGLQLSAVGPADEGLERVLDTLQERAAINAIFVEAFWFSPGTSEEELRELRQRGHASQRDANSKWRGSCMGRVHPRFYHDTALDPGDLMPAKAQDKDMLEALIPRARQRGMKVYCTFKDYLPDQPVPGREKLCEQDFNGANAEHPCKNNPHYRNLLAGAMRDLIESYNPDGIMFMAERQGAFADTLGLRFRGKERGRPGARTCFCEHCRAKAASQGIRFERAKAGFEELERFVAAGRGRQRPVDGYYVTLWRLLLRYPELLAWEHLWHESYRDLLWDLHRTVKATRPTVQFDSHIWPNHSFNPLLRAEQDLAAMAPYHDFIKFTVYHNCGGPRLASYIESAAETMFGDVPPDELLQFHYRVLGYDEAPYEQVHQTGLKRDFVYRESKRAVDAVRGQRTAIYPGVEMDIPFLRQDLSERRTAANAAQSTRQDVKAAVAQAFQAGAPGVVISREYTEMKLDNLSGVGDALRELGLKG